MTTSKKGTPHPAPHVGHEDEALYQHSLTPVNVIGRIRRDIIAVLGFHEGHTKKFTVLEEQLIKSFENIVRKGFSPATLARKKDIYEGLFYLSKYYNKLPVTISLEEKGKESRYEVLTFPTLYQYAKEAVHCDQRRNELRAQKTAAVEAEEKLKIDLEMDIVKRKKDDCLTLYQKIIFADAAKIRATGEQRSLEVQGKAITLDELIARLKKSQKFTYTPVFDKDKALKHPPEPEPVPIAPPMPKAPVTKVAPLNLDSTETIEEVVDWRQLKWSTKDNPDEANFDFDF